MTTLRLPLPYRELSSNGAHGHWTKTSAARKAYRGEMFWDVHEAAPKEWAFDKCRVSLTFCIKGGRKVQRYQPRDAANALSAFKSGLDGLIDAGMCPDDSVKHLELGAVRIDSTRGPYVEVTVEAI